MTSEIKGYFSTIHTHNTYTHMPVYVYQSVPIQGGKTPNIGSISNRGELTQRLVKIVAEPKVVGKSTQS